MKLLDANHPMFRRPWVRWATALVPLGWAGVEFSLGSPGWGMIFAAAGAYAFYVLVLRGPDQPT